MEEFIYQLSTGWNQRCGKGVVNHGSSRGEKSTALNLKVTKGFLSFYI